MFLQHLAQANDILNVQFYKRSSLVADNKIKQNLWNIPVNAYFLGGIIYK